MELGIDRNAIGGCGVERVLKMLGLKPERPPVRTRLPVPADVRPPTPRPPLAEIFTPTRPRAGRRSLIGRRRELARVVEALVDERAHVVLYSERGRGKTSLSNSVIEILRSRDVAVARTTCNAGSGFDDIMGSLARDLPASLLAVPALERTGVGCEAALPAGRLGPSDVVAMPSRLTCRNLVCILDEFDRVEDPAVRLLLADTIKQISDRGARLLFMVIGVSDSLDQLIGSHVSIRRNVVTVLLPLMPDNEMRQLVLEGAKEARYEFSPPLIEAITVLSRGMPYIAQLLGLRVAQAALARGADQANESDLRRAAERLVDEAEPRVVNLYASLTDDDDEMAGALRAVSTAEQDGFGFLQASQVGVEVVVGNRRIPRECWERLVEAEVLQPMHAATTKASFKITIRDRDLLTYVMLLTILKSGFRAEGDMPVQGRRALAENSIPLSNVART